MHHLTLFRCGLAVPQLLVLIAVAQAQPQLQPLDAPPLVLNRGEWAWSDADMRAMEALGKGLKKQRGGYILETSTWKIDCAVSPRFTVEVAYYLQQFSDVMRRTAPMICRAADPIVPRVTVFNNERDMQKRTGGNYSSWNTWNRNREELTELDLYLYSDNTSAKAFTYFDRNSLQYQATFALLRKSFKPVDVPPWFRSGHCDYFSCWDIRKSFEENHKLLFEAIGSGPMAQRIKHGGSMPRLADILALNHNQFARTGVSHINFHYEEATSLVECLMSEPKLREIYEKLFDRINDDRKPLLTPEQEALIETTWHARIKQAIQAAADGEAERKKAAEAAEAAAKDQGRADRPAAR